MKSTFSNSDYNSSRTLISCLKNLRPQEWQKKENKENTSFPNKKKSIEYSNNSCPESCDSLHVCYISLWFSLCIGLFGTSNV